MVTHERDVQVNVDIRATRERTAGLKGKTSEVDVKRIREKSVPLASGQEAG
jgi:hypothetical protein